MSEPRAAVVLVNPAMGQKWCPKKLLESGTSVTRSSQMAGPKLTGLWTAMGSIPDSHGTPNRVRLDLWKPSPAIRRDVVFPFVGLLELDLGTIAVILLLG